MEEKKAFKNIKSIDLVHKKNSITKSYTLYLVKTRLLGFSLTSCKILKTKIKENIRKNIYLSSTAVSFSMTAVSSTKPTVALKLHT